MLLLDSFHHARRVSKTALKWKESVSASFDISKTVIVPKKLTYGEGVYVTIGNPAFCFFLNLTGVHFWGKLQHGGDVSEQRNQVSTNQNSRNMWFPIVRLYGNLDKISAARMKIEVGKLRTRVAQWWGRSHQMNWGRMYGRPILTSELVYEISNIQHVCFDSMLATISL